MLPNKMRISERATKSLSRLQANTGLTLNIGARLAFFSSLEKGFRYNPEDFDKIHNGRELDKHTWLGQHSLIVESLLTQSYPNLTKSQHHDAWAAHVEQGASQIEAHTSLLSILPLNT